MADNIVQHPASNAATNRERRAVTVLQIIDEYAPKVAGWLDQVAEGVKGANGVGVLTRPDPAKALELYTKLLEFGVPKLMRSEITGKDGKDLNLPAVVTVTIAERRA